MRTLNIRHAVSLSGWVGLMTLTTGCGLFRKAEAPAVEAPKPSISPSAAMVSDQIERARFSPERFGYKAGATLVQNGRETSFKVEMRFERDKQIWINVSDPLMGISVARLLLTPDTALMYNRLDQTYTATTPEALTRRWGLTFSFADVQDLLLANVPQTQPEAHWIEDPRHAWTLDSARGRYALTSGPVVHRSEVSPLDYRPTLVSLRLSNPPVELDCRYGFDPNLRPASFPKTLEYALGLPYRTSLKINVQETLSTVPNFPFSIPQNFRRAP
ncbi:DUF4292 domain-containing protein [bacterium]|nr:DUF4292 domain-containing protein [bacterium]